ncbi:MAG: cytochrome c family protein [Planctomycetales bacterium]|nr:cytochrome c family protein [Planctomycetales bacterium]
MNIAARWLAALVSAALAATAVRAELPEDPHRLPLDPKQVLGHEACEKCHANEVATWKKTPHSTTFLTLHQKKEASEIAKKLGLSSIKRGQVCIECHYTPQASEESTQAKAISGVSCESCHGAAQKWVKLHSDYGGPTVTKVQESEAHKAERISGSIAAGMRNPHNLYLVAQSCFRCHTVPNEKLVNVGKHKVGTENFELVAWSQGLVRHNFLESNGKVNRPLTDERLRVMFVVGQIADLEFSLRATAEATEKAAYGITSAQRTDRAAKRLIELQTKINNPIVAEVLKAYKEVKLKLNNREQLLGCAVKIAALGEQFADEANGKDLAAVQPLLPGAEKYKK